MFKTTNQLGISTIYYFHTHMLGPEKNIGPWLGCATYTLWLFKIAMENEPNI